MGGKSNSSPDQSGVYAALASAQAAQQAYQLGQQDLDFTKQQWNFDQPIISRVAQGDENLQNEEEFAADQQNRESVALSNQYNAQTLPTISKLTNEANAWDSPEREQANAGSAEALVGSSMDAQRTSAIEQLEGFGIDPSSTRYAALDFGTRAQEGAAQAAAGTSAITNTKLQGMQLQQSAIEAGQGIGGTSVMTANAGSGAAGAGTGAGSGAAGSTISGLGTVSGAMAAPTAWFNSGAANMGTYVNAVNGFNYAQNQANSINNQGLSGLGSLAGGIMGMLAEGGPVSPDLSPSDGQAIDDVPARLTVGEGVIPKDVMEWEGQKFLYQTIDKARKAKQQAQGRSDIGGQPVQAPQSAINVPPAFVSRPPASAPAIALH